LLSWPKTDVLVALLPALGIAVKELACPKEPEPLSVSGQNNKCAPSFLLCTELKNVSLH
jgi:hypothetical protein